MLFPPFVLQGIADGTITLAVRRWQMPRVTAGGQQRSAAGVIAFDEVVVVERAELTGDDASAAGFASLDELHAFVDRRASGEIYRIRLRLAGPDPRIALRESLPDSDELQAIERRLTSLDRASRHGPWTRAVLRAIGERPGVRAPDLAAAFDRETPAFKTDVRKLKELGLTESLPRGYRLSPRGRSVLGVLEGSGHPR